MFASTCSIEHYSNGYSDTTMLYFSVFFFRSQLALISKRGIAASRHNTTKVLRYLALLLAIVAYVYISTTSIIVIYIVYICR